MMGTYPHPLTPSPSGRGGTTGVPYRTLLDARVLTDEDATADAIIYVETEKVPVHVTRGEFRQRVVEYAGALRVLGIQPRDLILIAHTQNLESIYAFWGALLAGAIPSMFPTLTEKLDPEIYQRSMAELARLSDVRAVLTTDEFAPVLAEHVPCAVYGSGAVKAALTLTPDRTRQRRVPTAGRGEQDGLEGSDREGSSSPPDPLSIAWRGGEKDPTGNQVINRADGMPLLPDPEVIAFLQHSSGTTGLQKGVALSHRAVLNQIASTSRAIGLNERDVIVSWLPLYHDMGLIAGFILPLVAGVPLVLMSPFDWVQHPALLFRAIHEYKGTLCWLPNFAYNHCARRIRSRDLEGLSAGSMRMFINCSEPVRHDSHQLFLERFGGLGVRPEMLAVSYAMAENTFAVTQTPPGELARLDIIDRDILEQQKRAERVPEDHPNASIRVSCGPAIPGAEVRAVDGNGAPLPERRVGELAVRSDSMLTGYYKRPDLDPFHEGWYLTGDMGYVADGEVYVVGRSKDLIINAGKNVYPQDIEAIVNGVPGVHAGRAVVFGVPDEREGTELIAVVAEVDEDDEAQRKEISAAIRQAVVRQSTVTVSYVHLVDSRWLIKTSSGKIARGANRDKWLAERRSGGQTPG